MKRTQLTIEEAVNTGRQPMKRTLRLRRMFHNMPYRKHWPDRRFPYDAAKSEVIKYLMAHPEAGEILFQLVQGARAIVYDPDRDAWVGASNRRPL